MKMDNSRQCVRESPCQSTGGLAASLPTNSYSNIPPDNAQAVAVETPSNPPSYWPLPPLPSPKYFKESLNDPQISASGAPGSFSASRSKGLAVDPSPKVEDELLIRKNQSENHLPIVPNKAAKILLHNLPPIAGITSSHNYRGIREVKNTTTDTTAKTKVEKLVDQSNAVKKLSQCAGSGEESRKNSNLTHNWVNERDISTPASTIEKDKTDNTQNSSCVSTNFEKATCTSRAPTPIADASTGLPEESSKRGIGSYSKSSPPSSTSSGQSPKCISFPCTPSESTLCRKPENSSLVSPPQRISSPSPSSNGLMASRMQKSDLVGECHTSVSAHSLEPHVNNIYASHGAVTSKSTTRDCSSPLNVAEHGCKNNSLFHSNQSNPNRVRLLQGCHEREGDMLQRKPQNQMASATCPSIDSSFMQANSSYSHHIQKQRHSLIAYQNNINLNLNTHKTVEPYPAASSIIPGNNFHASILRQTNTRVNDRKSDAECNSKMNFVSSSIPRDGLKYGITDGAIQRNVSNITQRNCSKVEDNSNCIGITADTTWMKPDPSSEFDNKFAYLNTQNLDHSGRNSDVKLQTTVHNVANSFYVSSGKGSDYCNSKSHTNSISLKFPPVPQSDYDLNRQIYDSMTGKSHRCQEAQPSSKPIEVNNSQYVSPKEQISQGSNVASRSSFPTYLGQNKIRTFAEYSAVNNAEFATKRRNTLLPGHDQDLSSQGQYQLQVEGQDKNRDRNSPQTCGFSRVEIKMPRDHRAHSRNASSDYSSSSTSYQSYAEEKGRTAPLKHSLTEETQTPLHSSVECLSANKIEEKSKNSGMDSMNCRNLEISTSRLQGRIAQSVSGPSRMKRESPLDLSVKTVRQSADSTAKDDSETHVQNYRNLLHVNPIGPSESGFSSVHLNDTSVGAPKIDFTPNFSGLNVEGPSYATASHPKTHVQILPPVGILKKFPETSASSAAQDFMARDDICTSSHSTPSTHSPNSHKTQNSFVENQLTAGEHHKRPNSNDHNRCTPSKAKMPKIDTWKLVFDQQIEQRLNSARICHQNNSNMARVTNGIDASASETNSRFSFIQKHSDGTSHYQSSHVYPQTPVQTSVTPYNPAYVQHNPTECQSATPQTPHERMGQLNVGHSPDPEQIIRQISKGVMPDYKLLQDKNVLSILRSSLEEKEAKLMQLREAAKRKEKCHEPLSSETAKKPFQVHEAMTRGSDPDKPNLPPFGALTLERMCAPPSFPGHRLNFPKSVDAVKIDVEPSHKYISSGVKKEGDKSGIPDADPSPQDEAQGPPTDLDGLAAFLAARIRTKGELKQVGPTYEKDKVPVIQHSTQSGSITSTEDLVSGEHAVSRTLISPSAFSAGSPPKLVRESRPLTPIKRRLFGQLDDETPTTSGQTPECLLRPSRDPNGIRSSSETSVFDFRESDSEGEMPVLERQTLDGMRRDRKTIGAKQNVPVAVLEGSLEESKPDVISELDKNCSDPFWDTAFDMFVEQLEKRPPKRSVKKKKNCSRVPFPGVESASSVHDERERNVDTTTSTAMLSVSDGSEVPLIVNKEPDNKISDEKTDILEKCVTLSSNHGETREDNISNVKDNKNVKKKAEERAKDVTRMKTRTKSRPAMDATADEGNVECDKLQADAVPWNEDGGGDDEEEEDEEDEDDEEDDDNDDDDDDDDESLSLSGLESESSDSEASQPEYNSNYSSYGDTDSEGPPKKRIQTRLQTRTSKQRQAKTTGMRLRSKTAPLPRSTPKSKKRKKKKKEEYYTCAKKKKPSFGDGSAFRPGWEEECYKFKQQLRMPEKLISISRPPKRSCASLPDLEPYRQSPSLDSSDVSSNKKSGLENSDDTDESSNKYRCKNRSGPSPNGDKVASLLRSRNAKKSQSVLSTLVNKCERGNGKMQMEAKVSGGRKSVRTTQKGNSKVEVLPPPSLGVDKENVLNNKVRGKDPGRKKVDEGESVFMGQYPKKAVKEGFKQKKSVGSQESNVGLMKSRTRTQCRDVKKRATLVEVFGDDSVRPASAPPLTQGDDGAQARDKMAKSSERNKAKGANKVCGGMITRGRGKLTRSGRPGLRSTAVHRSNKAVQMSKRHLNCGRKRNMELLRMRAMASKKFSYLVTSSDAQNQFPMTKKRLKLRSVRRKFRSGFDYIRKKKKLKKDGDSVDGSVKGKKVPVRATSESVEDIQNEIKNWVINKGLGETVLHRAARLGYTDVAAYCLEKLDCSPSPRDNAGYTPLHEACSRGHLEIAKLLLMYGASVSESAKGGIRPLHEAAENGFTELIRLLLSFGADPLLETYTGHTALSLVTDEEARRLIQHHLADVQGNVAPVWTFQGPSSVFDPLDNGYDPLCEMPSPEPVAQEYELEVSNGMLPPLYRLTADIDSERRWVLMKDLLTYTKVKSKETLLKQLKSSSILEMKFSDFFEQGKTCNLMDSEKLPAKTSKVILVCYDDKIRQLLDVEKVVV